jgi:hypothetical protein
MDLLGTMTAQLRIGHDRVDIVSISSGERL